MKTLNVLPILLLLCAFPTLADSTSDKTAEAIRAVFQEDAELSRTRNHASEKAPVVEAIRTYIAGLDSIDYSGTPEDFAAAFKTHRDAWAVGLDFLAQFEDERGEMHALFDGLRARGGEIQQRLESFEKGLFSTWGEVEAAAHKHGVEP